MRKGWLLLTGALLAAQDARAQGAPPATTAHATSTERDAAAYCKWVKAVAASTSDVLLLPAATATAGYVSGSDSTQTLPALSATARVTLAGQYSLQGLNRGMALRAQADAECKRYATTSDLRAFIERNRDAQSARALKAKAKVLDDALPHAVEILANQKAQLAQARMTVEEVDGTQLRTDTLRTLAGQTHQEIAALAATPPPPKQSIKETLAQRDAAEVEVERQDGRVRASFGWDLLLRGGYDEVFALRQTTPFFGLATLTVNLGWFFQGANNADAREARAEWVRAEVEGLDDRVEQVAQRLRAVRDAETARLRDSTTLMADLEGRYRSVSQIPGEKARAYAEYVWFDLVRVQAEHAYYVEHVRELNELLGEGGGT